MKFRNSHLPDISTRHHLTEELCWCTIGRIEAGQNQSYVARWLNLSPFVIQGLWDAFLRTESVPIRYSRGRPRATSAADDFCLLCVAICKEAQNRYITSDVLLRRPLKS
ncbi:hypothetical protein AVEN_251528-1 [Araneus ventricosus]|uniref:Uncharacterized protein n=1 Tax=Araneus ventricosus TaxID=182803 RepID=A0A4Y2X1Q9_ARAVE|nr:hypothetical protein AVEN_251528-1 [Araneus ventricosus]